MDYETVTALIYKQSSVKETQTTNTIKRSSTATSAPQREKMF